LFVETSVGMIVRLGLQEDAILSGVCVISWGFWIYTSLRKPMGLHYAQPNSLYNTNSLSHDGKLVVLLV
jgi:hypothetical protein